MIYRTDNKFTGSFLYLKGEDTDDEICYEITGLKSFADAYKDCGIPYPALYSLTKKLMEYGTGLNEKQADLNGWILNPQYIYVMEKSYKESSALKIKFFYYSGKSGLTFSSEINSLAEFIIEHVDYRDKAAVELAYDLYMHIYGGNYVFADLL